MRRSRTESSVAAPATEELAGEARQVRPARAACGFVSTDFRLLAGGEVWRALGPPAPPGHQILAEARISASALTASRRSRNFPFRYCLLLSKRSGERPPFQLPKATKSSQQLIILRQEFPENTTRQNTSCKETQWRLSTSLSNKTGSIV